MGNRWLRLAGWAQVVYGTIEVLDCFTLILMQLGWLDNPYPALNAPVFDDLLGRQPILLLPLFLFFTYFRMLSGVGILRGCAWGTWAALFVSIATLIFVPVLFPFSSLDLLAMMPVMTGLLLGGWGPRAPAAAGA